MNSEQAQAAEAALRATVPESWDIESHNTECRPGHAARYKVVAKAAGMAIVAAAGTGSFYVTIDIGPGMAESLSAAPMGFEDMGFEDAAVAYGKLVKLITARHKRVSAQFAALL